MSVLHITIGAHTKTLSHINSKNVHHKAPICCRAVRVDMLQSSYSTLLLTYLFLWAVKLGLILHILDCTTVPNQKIQRAP